VRETHEDGHQSPALLQAHWLVLVLVLVLVLALALALVMALAMARIELLPLAALCLCTPPATRTVATTWQAFWKVSSAGQPQC
jgi:ABC-type branched-subunit amino acid transport system permease subunit